MEELEEESEEESEEEVLEQFLLTEGRQKFLVPRHAKMRTDLIYEYQGNHKQKATVHLIFGRSPNKTRTTREEYICGVIRCNKRVKAPQGSKSFNKNLKIHCQSKHS